MRKSDAIKRLAKDFAKWGLKAVHLVEVGTKKWGTQFRSFVMGDGSG